MTLNRTVAASLFVLAATVVFAVACGSGDETIEPRETQAAATETTEKHKTQPDAAEPDEERETQPDAAEPDEERETQPDAAEPDEERETQSDAAEPDEERETQPDAAEPDEERETQPDAAETDEERETQPDAADPEIVFLGAFTDEEKAAIAREVKSVQAAFAERFGVVTSEFTLYISTEYEALNEAYREWLAPEWRRRGVELPDGFTCNGLTGREAIFIAIESCDHPTRARGGPIAHEYFHILQLHLGLVAGPSAKVWTTWLIEGAAAYAATHHAEEQGRWTVSWHREIARLEWSGLGRRLPGPYDTSEGKAMTGFEFNALTHEVGFLAVEWLVERKGEEALIEFFRLGGGRQEFAKAFDMTPDEFVAAFEEHRQQVAPPFEWRMAGRVLDPDGQPVAYARIETLVNVEGQWTSAGSADANSRGEFQLYGPGTGHRLGIFLKCTVSGLWIFAGQWGSEGFVADENRRWDAEDEAAEPFTDAAHRTDIVIQIQEPAEALLERHCE